MSMKHVQQFLGLANYYQQFIEDFSKGATPLNKLLRKEQQWEWTEVQQGTFDKLKKWFTMFPILVNSDLERPMRIESDASEFMTRAVLSVKGKDEKWRPCTFYSKMLNDVERNYDVHDREILSIIRALEVWRHYVEGAKHKVEIWSDHQNLQYFMTSKKLIEDKHNGHYTYQDLILS